MLDGTVQEAPPRVLRVQSERVSNAWPPADVVGAGGLSPNTWKRLERLSSAWEREKRDGASEEPPAAEPDPGVVANPTRRSRTPLTEREADAIRTAKATGESTMSIAKRFGIHRVTVWEHTKR